MKVSVVMPVYNGEKYLNEAIDSVLNQTFSDFEFIIINDCSSDNTEDIIKSYNDDRIIYIKNDVNLGVALSLNKGLDAAQGEYIVRLDADDICLPERLRVQVEYMDAHKNVDVCGSASESFDENGVLFYGFPSKEIEMLKIDLIFSSSICHPTVIMRRSTLERNGYRYDNNFNKVEDYHLWVRMLNDNCVITNTHDLLLRHRIHNEQVTDILTDDMYQKLYRLHGIIFNNINISITDSEMENFIKYCIRGKVTYDYSCYTDLFNVLYKIYKTKYCDRKLYNKCVTGIVITFMKESENPIRVLCKMKWLKLKILLSFIKYKLI